MKNSVHIVLAAASILLLNAFAAAQQAPSIQWERSFGGSETDFANSIQQTSDSGYIVAGYSNSTDGDVIGNHGQDDYWVIKLNASGLVQWKKTYGGSGIDRASCVRQTTDGGYILAGYSVSGDGEVTGNHANADFWIVKLDANGNLIWERSLGGTDNEAAFSIEPTRDGGYIVAGYSRSSNSGDVTLSHGISDFWIVKLDQSGGIQWQNSYGGSDDEDATSIEQTTDGGYIVAGYTYSTDQDVALHHGTSRNSDYWILKLDGTGAVQWKNCYGGSNDDFAESIHQTGDGGYIVAGYSKSIDGDVTWSRADTSVAHYWIVKLNASGAIQWQRSLGGGGNSYAYSLCFANGGYAIAGYSDSPDGDVTGVRGAYDYWIVQLDTAGNTQWEKTFGGSSEDEAESIQQTADGGYIVAGTSSSTDGDVTENHAGTWDYWIVKLGPENDTSLVGIQVTNPINAGTVHVDSSKTVSFTIRNTSGTKSAVITQMVLQGAFASDYQLLSHSMPDTIASGSSQVFNIAFTPQQAGTLDATLHILSNASPAAMDIAVIGIGARSIIVAEPVNFDTVNVDSCKTLDLIIRNAGNFPLTIAEMDMLGVYAGNYTVLNNVTDTLHPGDTARIAIRYCPTASGEEDVVAEIITNDGDTLFVDIYGTGGHSSSVSGSAAMPLATTLSQNYPDPFVGATTFHVTLSASDMAFARLHVYNMLGAVVADLSDRLRQDGDVVFASAGLPAGVYYCALETRSARITRQMFLIK
jgi:hypothetical protein